MKEIRESIDLLLFDPVMTEKETVDVAVEAAERGFFGVTLLPCYLKEIADRLRERPVRLSSVIGYPHGSSTVFSKLFEALELVRLGASLIDVPLHPGSVNGGTFKELRREMEQVMEKTPECRHRFTIHPEGTDRKELGKLLRTINKVKPHGVRAAFTTHPNDAVKLLALIKDGLEGGIHLEVSGSFESSREVAAVLDERVEKICVPYGPIVLSDDF